MIPNGSTMLKTACPMDKTMKQVHINLLNILISTAGLIPADGVEEIRHCLGQQRWSLAWRAINEYLHLQEDLVNNRVKTLLEKTNRLILET